MGIWERIVLFFKVKASADLDRAEDPREILDYSTHQQEEFLQIYSHLDLLKQQLSHVYQSSETKKDLLKMNTKEVW